MGIARKTLIEFIDSIPDGDLTSFPPCGGTIYADNDYRLDNQGVSYSFIGGDMLAK